MKAEEIEMLINFASNKTKNLHKLNTSVGKKAKFVTK